MTYIGVVLLIVGAILWLTVAPGLGYVFVIVGVILLIVGLLLEHRGRV